MKMTGRLVKFKMKKKEWDEAKKNIDIILNVNNTSIIKDLNFKEYLSDK